VFSCEVYHGALFLDRPAINVPFDEAQLARVRDHYGIRYMTISLSDLRSRLPAWETRPPAWAGLAAQISPDSLRRSFPSAAAMDLDEVRIYRLSAARGEKD